PSPPAGSRRPPTRRCACSWARTASSSAPGSSSRAIRNGVPRRSSRRRRTSATRTSWPASPPVSVSQWSASRALRSTPASCSKRAAGSGSVRRGEDDPPVREVKPIWTSASFLVYTGGLIVLLSAIAALVYLSILYGSGAQVGWAFLVLAVLYV